MASVVSNLFNGKSASAVAFGRVINSTGSQLACTAFPANNRLWPSER
jgi:hypothetical protein